MRSAEVRLMGYRMSSGCPPDGPAVRPPKNLRKVMTPVRIRPFARGDRDQLAVLVNAHLAAVTPGASISVQALLSHLERQPAEFIVDPVGHRAGPAGRGAAPPDRGGRPSVALRRRRASRLVLSRHGRDSLVGLLSAGPVLAGRRRSRHPADPGLPRRAGHVAGAAEFRGRHGAGWLDLGGIGRLMAYVSVDATPAEAAFWSAVGFSELTRTVRGLTRPG